MFGGEVKLTKLACDSRPDFTEWGGWIEIHSQMTEALALGGAWRRLSLPSHSSINSHPTIDLHRINTHINRLYQPQIQRAFANHLLLQQHTSSCLPSRIRLRPISARLIRRYAMPWKSLDRICRAFLDIFDILECLSARVSLLAEEPQADHNSPLAFQVPRLEQPREADICPQGLRFPRSYRNLFLLHFLQHRWTTPYKLGRFCHSWILLFGGLVQCGQSWWYSVAHGMSQISCPQDLRLINQSSTGSSSLSWLSSRVSSAPSTGSHSTTHLSLCSFCGSRSQSPSKCFPSTLPLLPTDDLHSGAQVVFRSFIQPVFSRYFSGPGATAANLRSKVDGFGDKSL